MERDQGAAAQTGGRGSVKRKGTRSDDEKESKAEEREKEEDEHT
jgi:hypothetical protein